MTETSTTTPPSLIIQAGAYLLSVETRKVRIRTQKEVPIYVDNRFSGSYETHPVTVWMTQIMVTLVHPCGDTLRFTHTAMGRRISVTRTSEMTKATVVNKTAFGPELLEVGGKAESSSLDTAIATISRMTGRAPVEVRRFFNYDLIEAGVVQ